MARLDGKVCVITGAASGIGAEATSLFLNEGATVVAVDIAALSACSGVDVHQVDVSDEASVSALYRSIRAVHGRIDVLFNNAGISPPEDASVLETTAEVWHRILDVNALSVFLCCKHGIPHLLETGGGSVINTASFVAVVGSATSQIAYTASKGAVLAMTRELGIQFARQGIRVNALCSGTGFTPLLQQLFATDPAQAARRMVHVPMGRFAQPHELAQAALYLASDESSYVNASTFLVDGGISAGYVTAE